MVETLQKKFTVTAMIAVTVLLGVLLGAINVFNAVSASAESRELLEMLASFEDFGPAPRWDRPEDLEEEPLREGVFRRRPDENDRMSALTFTVRFDAEEALESVDLERIATVSETEAEDLGRRALASGKTSGTLEGYHYKIVYPAPETSTVVFLDVSSQQHSILRVAALSGLGGVLAWLCMLGLVSALSRRAIRPIAENMERQRQFVTDAGHELKTPLAIIQANTEAMELMGGENKYSRNIRAQVQRLTGLTQNLLTLAKTDEIGTELRRESLSFSELTRESLEMFRASAELKKLSIRAEIEEGIRLQADRQQIRQLLSILLDNAVKYCPEGGTLSVNLQKEGKTVLRIANTVSEKNADPQRFFDRFYRADSSRSRETGGYGIGLSAAQAIVRLHGGSISAAYEGEKIVFTVRLP